MEILSQSLEDSNDVTCTMFISYTQVIFIFKITDSLVFIQLFYSSIYGCWGRRPHLSKLKLNMPKTVVTRSSVGEIFVG